MAIESLVSVDRPLAAGVAGPQELAVGEWIVQLTDDATTDVHQVANVDVLLDDDTNQFTIISDLGSPGFALVRVQGLAREHPSELGCERVRRVFQSQSTHFWPANTSQ